MCSGVHSVLTPVLVLVVLLLVNGVYAQNLFPPVQSTKNFALRQPATTTSTCRTCEVEQAECAPCNNSCPHNGQQLPEPLNLLEVGTLASGVIQTDMNSVANSSIYKFNGSNESFVALREELTFQPTRGFTFTAWVQQDPGNEGYVFAKTTQNGATTFYALFLDSEEQSATFQYRHMGLEEGFRSLILPGINMADRQFHHIAVSVFGSSLALYIDGQLHSAPMLVANVEDGSGVVFLGCRVKDRSRFSGLMHSVFYFNSTLSNNNIATLAAVASDLYIQPECQCPPSHSIVLERDCQDLSGTNRISRINSAAHDATYINDGNTSTWWQSSNGETPVNVTVGLGGLRAALTVVMHFKSLLPRAMVLYYSTNGELFSPRQFYAVNCSMLSFLSNGSLSTSTDVSCVTFNSSSLCDRYVEFRVLDVGNQTGVGDYFMNSDLLEFAQASHVRLELLAWDTDELADQYFAISEVIVYGQACVCNGHATMCNGATCVCEQNTTGTHCELCLEGYFNYNPEVCELCRCNTVGTTGGSNICDSATGQCPCESNFVGLNCSLCASGYYWNGSDGNCLPCDDRCLECTGPGPTNCEIEATPTSILPTPQVESSTNLLLPVPSAVIEPQVSAVLEDMPSSISKLTLQPSLLLSESNLTRTLSFSKTNRSNPQRAIQVPSMASMESFTNEEVSSTMLSHLIPITSTSSESMDTVSTIISPSPSTTTMEETLLLHLPSSELFIPSEIPFLLTSELLLDKSSLPLPSQLLHVTTTSIISETPAILKQTVSPQPTDITLSSSQPQVMSMLPQVRVPEPLHIIRFLFMSTLFSTPNPSVTSHSETTPQQTLQPGSSSTLAVKQTTPQPSMTTFVLEGASSFMEIRPTVTSTITHMPVASSSSVELMTQLSESYSLDSSFPAVTFKIPPQSTVSQLFLEKFSLNTTPSTYLPSPTSSVSSLTFTVEPSFSSPPTTSSPLSYLMTTQPISTSQTEETPTSTLPTPQVESSTTLLQPVPSAVIEPQVSAVLEDMPSSISELTLQPSLSLSESNLTQTLLLNQVTSLLQLSASNSTATARSMTPSLISSSVYVNESSSTYFPSSLLTTIQPTTHLSLSETPVPTVSFPLSPQLLLTSPGLEPASTSPRAPSSSMVTLNEGLASSNNTFMSFSDQVSLSELLMQNPSPTPVMHTSSVTSVQTEIPPLINQTVDAPFLTQLPITPSPVLTTPPFLSESISESVIQLMSAEVITLSTSSVDPANVSTHLTITGVDTSFSQPSSRSDIQLPTSVGIIEPTAVLNISAQVTPSLTRRTSDPANVSTHLTITGVDTSFSQPSSRSDIQLPTSVGIIEPTAVLNSSVQVTPSLTRRTPDPANVSTHLTITGMDASFSQPSSRSDIQLPTSVGIIEPTAVLNISAQVTPSLTRRTSDPANVSTHLTITGVDASFSQPSSRSDIQLPTSVGIIEPTAVLNISVQVTPSLTRRTSDPANVSTHLTITGMDTSFSQPSSRSDIQLPTSVGIIEPTTVLNSSVQVTPSLTRRTPDPANVSTHLTITGMDASFSQPFSRSDIQLPTSVGIIEPIAVLNSSVQVTPSLTRRTPDPANVSAHLTITGVDASFSQPSSRSDIQLPTSVGIIEPIAVLNSSVQVTPSLTRRTSDPANVSTHLTITGVDASFSQPSSRSDIQLPTSVGIIEPTAVLNISVQVTPSLTRRTSDPANVSTHLTITGMDTSFSQPSSRSDIQLPTSVGIIEPTAVLNSSVQVTPSLTRRTSVITTEVPHVSTSQLMAVPSTTPVIASPTSVTNTIGPKLITQSPSFTLTATPVPFMCPQSPQVNYMANHLVDIVLGLIVIEHMELAVDRSPRQCRLEQALVEEFDLGLQQLSEGSQGKKKRQLQNSGNYAANITEVGQLSNGQSTITFYIINVTSTEPFIATTVVQALLEANLQDVDTYPVIRQASPHAVESSTVSSTIVPIVAGVAGGSLLLVGLLVAVVLLWCLVWRFRRKQENELLGVETHHTSDFDEYTIDSIENQRSLVPSHPISTEELFDTDMEHGVLEDEQNIRELQVPATFFERVTHYDTPRSSSLMQPRFRGTVAPHPFTTLENSQDEYVDSEGDGDSVQRERLRKNMQRLQEERDQQALKARRKATLKHCSGSRRKRTKVDLSTHDKDRLLHSQNSRKFVETVGAPLPLATPTSDLPGSPTYHFTRRRHHLRYRVHPLATVRLPRSQHKDGTTLSQLSTSGRLPRHIAHGVQQELTWMRTGSGVQLLRVHPAQMVGQSSPVPTQLSCPPLFTTHTHVHTQPQDDGSRSSATDGEADQPTSPDRQQDPELGNSVQDLIQQAFSYTTLSIQQVASLSPQSGYPSSHAQCASPHPQLSPQAEFIEEKGQVVWIPPTHPALHSSPTLGLQGNQNSTNSSLYDHEQPFPSPQHVAHP